MSYIISSPFFKICISEQNCTSKHFKTQPRIVECETGNYFEVDGPSCPILTFSVQSMNELCVDIYFTDKDKTFDFSVDKYYHTESSLEKFPGEKYADDEKMTGELKINREILIPNNEIYRGGKKDHGLIIWIDEKAIGIFCSLPKANEHEKLNESLNIFDASISIARVLLLSDESTQSRVLLSSDENMQSKILTMEIKNKFIFEDMIKLIAQLLLRIEQIEEKIENKCCSSSEK